MTAVVWLLVGLGLGFLRPSRDSSVAAAPASQPPAPSTPAAASAERAAPIVLAAAPPARSTSATLPKPAEPNPSVVALQEKVLDLEQQLAIERAIRKSTEGERIEPPANLPPRFRDEHQLLTTFNQALKVAGFPGQVSNIDCTEHPCIVFGTGFGERGDLDKLKGQLGPYENDSFSTYGFGSADGKKEHRFFGVAVMPELKQQPDDATVKRIGFRVNQMREASKPPPAPKPWRSSEE